MRKFTGFLLILICLSANWNLSAQISVTNKRITLPTGEVSLKTIFSTISQQTGYVFSYDATTINDNRRIVIEKNNGITLETSLDSVLPSDIRYRIIDKYIVLNRIIFEDIPKYSNPVLLIAPDLNLSQVTPQKTPHLNDSLLINPVIQPGDSSGMRQAIRRLQWSLDANYTPHLMHLSLLVGKNTLFGKASIGYDQHNSYHVGLGIGTQIHLTKALGISLDLSQYALVFGKSKKMEISTYTTELNPNLYYTLNKRIKLKAGPSIYFNTSNMTNKQATIDLGSHLGYQAAIGMQILLVDSN